jgi:hypothetical protein
MHGEGWAGGRMEERRRHLELQLRRKGKRKEVRDNVSRVLEVNIRWWGGEDSEYASSESSDGDDEFDDSVFVSLPPADCGRECSALNNRHLQTILVQCSRFHRRGFRTCFNRSS